MEGSGDNARGDLVSQGHAPVVPQRGVSIPVPTDLLEEPQQVALGAGHFNPSLGSASLRTTRDLARTHRFRLGSFFVGRTIEDDVVPDGHRGQVASAPLGHKGEGHILICAETRTGKSERVLVPNLALWPGSALVVDCKGMLATMTAERRGPGNRAYCDGMGQKVRVIDPQRIANVPEEMRATINPVDWLSADNPDCIYRARILAEALIPDDDGKAADPYWPNEGRELLACIMTHVATYRRIADECRTLRTVYDLITRGHQALYDALVDAGDIDPDEDAGLSPFDALFCGMADNPVFNDYVSTYGGGLEELFAGARKQYEGIASQARLSLGWLCDPQMEASMRKSQVRFADLKDEQHGATIYLSLKSMKANWRWVRLMVKMFAEETQTIRPPATGHQTLVVLDEFTSLKAMPEINDLMDKSAEYGIRMCIVVQRLEQLKETYPNSWGQFYAAADLRWFFGTECHMTREFLEKELGEVEVVRTARGLSIADTENVSRTTTQSVTETQGESSSSTNTLTHGTSSGTNDSISNGAGTHFSRGNGHKQSIAGLVPGVKQIYDSPFIAPGEKNRSSGGHLSHQTTSGTQNTTSDSVSSAEQRGSSYSHASSSSEANQSGTSHAVTPSITEHIHKRPLIAFSEFPTVLQKVEDTHDPRFPGQALVIARGGMRTLVRTCKYYEDPLFHRCYGSHPLYEFKQSPYPWTELSALEHRERRIEAELARRFAPIRAQLAHDQETAARQWFKRECDELIARVQHNFEQACLSFRVTLSLDQHRVNQLVAQLPAGVTSTVRNPPYRDFVEADDTLLSIATTAPGGQHQLMKSTPLLEAPHDCVVVASSSDQVTISLDLDSVCNYVTRKFNSGAVEQIIHRHVDGSHISQVPERLRTAEQESIDRFQALLEELRQNLQRAAVRNFPTAAMCVPDGFSAWRYATSELLKLCGAATVCFALLYSVIWWTTHGTWDLLAGIIGTIVVGPVLVGVPVFYCALIVDAIRNRGKTRKERRRSARSKTAAGDILRARSEECADTPTPPTNDAD